MSLSDLEDFPILMHWGRDERKKQIALGCPNRIPGSIIASHEKQAQKNHYQTLKRLAERGGLSPSEAVAVIEDREWRRMSDEDSIARLNQLLSADSKEISK